MKLSSIRVNAAAIETGRWVQAPTLPGVRFKVRGFGNTDYVAQNARLLGAIPRADRLKGLSNEDSDRIANTLLVETILLDWDGIENDDGGPLTFSKEKAAELLANPDYRALRSAIEFCANIVGEDELAESEADAKN